MASNSFDLVIKFEVYSANPPKTKHLCVLMYKEINMLCINTEHGQYMSSIINGLHVNMSFNKSMNLLPVFNICIRKLTIVIVTFGNVELIMVNPLTAVLSHY